MTESHKYCEFCQCYHTLSEDYWYFSTKKSGRRTYECKNRTKDRRLKRLDDVKSKQQEYRSKNRDVIRERNRAWREKNKNTLSEKQKIRYENKKEEIKQKVKEYYRQNKEKVRVNNKKYRNENRSSIAQKKREYKKLRRKTDKTYLIRESLRNRLNVAIRKSGAQKSFGFCETIGCSYEELRFHIENQFVGGMNWENYGGKDGWSIDHIRPISSFDLNNPEDVKKANHYTNLQPMWIRDNISKGASWVGAPPL